MTLATEEIERRTGSRARRLMGHLADHANPDVAACPDEIAEEVAYCYALTECGRLFHWRFGELREVQAVNHPPRFNIRIQINHTTYRWDVHRSTLLKRVWPDRPPGQDEIDWSAYDPEGDSPEWLGDLAQTDVPDNAGVVDRCGTKDEVERANRLFWSG